LAALRGKTAEKPPQGWFPESLKNNPHSMGGGYFFKTCPIYLVISEKISNFAFG
jgi:hypothetical protein